MDFRLDFFVFLFGFSSISAPFLQIKLRVWFEKSINSYKIARCAEKELGKSGEGIEKIIDKRLFGSILTLVVAVPQH